MDPMTFRKHMSISEDMQTVYVLGVPFMHFTYDPAKDESNMIICVKTVKKTYMFKGRRNFELRTIAAGAELLYIGNTINDSVVPVVAKTFDNPMADWLTQVRFGIDTIAIRYLTPIPAKYIK